MKNIVTKIGYRKLRKRLEELKSRRAELVKEMELTRQEGDLAENSAYHQLRETIILVASQIDDIGQKLVHVEIAEKNNNGVVEVGSELVVEVNGQVKNLQIVGNGESNPLKGKISYQSPIGAGLLGKKRKAVIKIKTPRGTIEYRILEIK